MNLRPQTKTATQQQSFSLAERAQQACALANQLERTGEYEAAVEALSEFWPDRQSHPIIEGLDQQTRAELLLRVGALAGWLGSTDQLAGSQEVAKNLITESIEAFEELEKTERVAEARADLALCYWREGAFDEARINLAEALNALKNQRGDLRARVLIRAGMVELRARRLNEALRIHKDAAALADQSTDHALKGAFHNQLATLYENLGRTEPGDNYIDRALIEYAAASFHFDQAGNRRFLARVENNLGYLFFTIGRYSDAHRHLDRARSLFLELGDTGTAAQVSDTRARTLLAEGHWKDAERYARSAVKTLEKGDEQAILAEALTTYARVLARLGNHARARTLLERATEIALTAGDSEGAGRAQLSIVEELAAQTMPSQLVSIYESAADRLQHSQDPAANQRLITSARKVIDTLIETEQKQAASVDITSWEGFSFKREVRKIEKALIERALRDAGGSVSKAARLLGFKHHQSLIAIINSRHTDLREKRSAVRKRRKHLFSKPKRSKGKTSPQNTEPAPAA